MGSNEFKNLTLFVKVAHISIFHTEFFSFFEDIHLEYQKKKIILVSLKKHALIKSGFHIKCGIKTLVRSGITLLSAHTM